VVFPDFTFLKTYLLVIKLKYKKITLKCYLKFMVVSFIFSPSSFNNPRSSLQTVCHDLLRFLHHYLTCFVKQYIYRAISYSVKQFVVKFGKFGGLSHFQTFSKTISVWDRINPEHKWKGNYIIPHN
jgi:hypothetical protein